MISLLSSILPVAYSLSRLRALIVLQRLDTLPSASDLHQCSLLACSAQELQIVSSLSSSEIPLQINWPVHLFSFLNSYRSHFCSQLLANPSISSSSAFFAASTVPDALPAISQAAFLRAISLSYSFISVNINNMAFQRIQFLIAAPRLNQIR